MRYLQNRTALSFGLPLAITAILLLVLNVFWFKKNADGDYIDNGLVYETKRSETKNIQMVYEGVGVIELRDDLKIAIKNLDKLVSDMSISEMESEFNESSLFGADSPFFPMFNFKKEHSEEDKSAIRDAYTLWFTDRAVMTQSVEQINKKIESHNNSNDFFRFLYSVILILFPLYVLPISISFFRLHSYRWPISIITVFTAWTGIGYVLMLTWSAWPKGKFS